MVNEIALFNNLEKAQKAILKQYFEDFSVVTGEQIIHQGAIPHGLYVICEGSADVAMKKANGDTELLTMVGEGDVVGEISLVDRLPAVAGVLAKTDVRGYFLHRKYFKGINLLYPDIGDLISKQLTDNLCREIRKYASRVYDIARQISTPMIPNEQYLTWEQGVERVNREDFFRTGYLSYLKKLACFRAFRGIEIEQLLTYFDLVKISQHTVLFKEGDEHPTSCFLVINGSLQSLVHRGDDVSKFQVAGPGHLSGVAGFVDGQPRIANCIAREESMVLLLEKSALEKLVETHSVLANQYQKMIHHALCATVQSVMNRYSKLYL